MSVHAVRCTYETITWRACVAMLCQRSRQTGRRCLQTDRQTWAQLLTKCECSIYGGGHVGKEDFFLSAVCEAWRRTGKQLWAELSTWTRTRVWKVLHCSYLRWLPSGHHEPSEPDTTHIVCRGLEIIAALAGKRCTQPHNNHQQCAGKCDSNILPPPRIHTQIVETVLGIFQMQMQRRDKGFLANCLSCKSTEGERRNHRGDWGYGCFKAKQLIVIFLRSGVSTFTLQLDFKMLPPPPSLKQHAQRGV